MSQNSTVEDTKPDKRKRKPNFSQRELNVITESVETKKDILQSKFTNNLTNQMKQKVWLDITAKVNAVGVAYRTVEEVRVKWKALFSVAKKEYSVAKKGKRQTGGGPPPKEPSEISKQIVEVYDNTPGFSGIEGGFETGENIYQELLETSEDVVGDEFPTIAFDDIVEEPTIAVLAEAPVPKSNKRKKSFKIMLTDLVRMAWQ
ncbi:myb/SANT-like DNA-binding domain-containing protein 4 isoform X2 [Nematostella vectensis]|uniref:myb/SANT-like DNA-binding domain-containing protein 4 isoform X2 n=1 Tax=Nematostella vectensis TaxID=45351 RepID=UPI0020778965|nr:myb/SANT-like DNA-binding domain-containing protein 4 isoform X2 [Nematostella vectensis]